MAKLWSVRKVVIIPIVIGALGTLSRNFKKYVEGLEMRQLTSLLQKSCILGTEILVPKVEEFKFTAQKARLVSERLEEYK